MRKILIFIACVLCFALGSLSTFALMQWSTKISSSATIKAVGVAVYQDSGLTIPLTSINWGILEPGETKNVTCYVVNQSNVPIVLSLTTANWTPGNTNQYIILYWNYSGATILVSNYIPVVFSLHVDPTISGITNFTFGITITGSG